MIFKYLMFGRTKYPKKYIYRNRKKNNMCVFEAIRHQSLRWHAILTYCTQESGVRTQDRVQLVACQPLPPQPGDPSERHAVSGPTWRGHDIGRQDGW